MPLPIRSYVGFWKRLLHDQTGRELFRVLSQLAGVTVTLVPSAAPTVQRGGISRLRQDAPYRQEAGPIWLVRGEDGHG